MHGPLNVKFCAVSREKLLPVYNQNSEDYQMHNNTVCIFFLLLSWYMFQHFRRLH